MSDTRLANKLDESGITVEFHRSPTDLATYVVFKIPDTAQVLSRSPEEFFRWCYEEMMEIGRQARTVRTP